jgi:putative tryptophan/tyrosine transport system substrate-binding protein
MNVRTLLLASGLIFAVQCALAQAPAKTMEIGLLVSGHTDTASPLVEAFRAGLSAEGLSEGGTIKIIVETAQEAQEFERLAQRLSERPNVVVGASLREVRWLMHRYPTTPVVMVAVGDPVGLKLVQTLSRPGGRVTGLSDFRPEYAETRLALAKAFVPGLRRIGFIHNPDAPTARHTYDAALRLNIEIVPLIARTAADLHAALMRVERPSVDALVVVPYPLTFSARKTIAEKASEQRVPVIFGYPQFMDLAAPAAGIASMGADVADLYRRAAGYVAKILAGENPAELPVGTPEREMIVVNRATAHALGISIPDEIIKRASRIID